MEGERFRFERVDNLWTGLWKRYFEYFRALSLIRLGSSRWRGVSIKVFDIFLTELAYP